MEDASKAGMGPLCSWHFVAQCPLTPLQVAEFKSIGGRRTLVSKKSARPSLENRSPRFIGSGMLWLLSLLYFDRQVPQDPTKCVSSRQHLLVCCPAA